MSVKCDVAVLAIVVGYAVPTDVLMVVRQRHVGDVKTEWVFVDETCLAESASVPSYDPNQQFIVHEDWLVPVRCGAKVYMLEYKGLHNGCRAWRIDPLCEGPDSRPVPVDTIPPEAPHHRQFYPIRNWTQTVAVASTNDAIWLTGGSQSYDSVFRLDLADSKWRCAGTLPCKVSDHTATFVPTTDSLAIAERFSMGILASLKVRTTDDKRDINMAMPFDLPASSTNGTASSATNGVTLKGSVLVVVGGRDFCTGKPSRFCCASRLSKCEESCKGAVEAVEWAVLPPLNWARRGHTAAVVDNLLIIAGGMKQSDCDGPGINAETSVEVLSLERVHDGWSVLSNLPESDDYWPPIRALGSLVHVNGTLLFARPDAINHGTKLDLVAAETQSSKPHPVRTIIHPKTHHTQVIAIPLT